MNPKTGPGLDSIKCPSCGRAIPITVTLQHQFAELARAEVQQEYLAAQNALAARESELETRETTLAKAARDIEGQLEARLALERPTLQQGALRLAREEVGVQIKDLEAAAKHRERQLQEAETKELQLRKEKRELEDARRGFDLEVLKAVDAERAKIREDASAEAWDSYRLKEAEKDRKLQEAMKVNDQLRLKLQQGSQQVQGDVLEVELHRLLQNTCPLDEILAVPTGVAGADILQKVRTGTGLPCGSILWEAKHTKNWSEAWIEKLKKDQQQAKADVAVIVSDVLPKEVEGFGLRQGIWVTSARNVAGLLAALRYTLVEVAFAKTATASKNQSVEALFIYLTGAEFRHRVEAIVRAFINLRTDLDEEKRVAARRWAKREKELDLIIGNTGGMYGDLQGLVGAPMRAIPALEGERLDPNTELVASEASRA